MGFMAMITLVRLIGGAYECHGKKHLCGVIHRGDGYEYDSDGIKLVNERVYEQLEPVGSRGIS